ncbi:MAG: triose-phosphate isomerase [Alteromonadaceae bacterium]|nr:triose-phosphate isomerase [Alteromonadaceae bacterium]
MIQRRKLVAGNWKLNGDPSLVTTFDQGLGNVNLSEVDIVICPPAVFLPLFQSDLGLGGQNLASRASGAFTGEISSEQLASVGAQYVIVGHSERREMFAEDNNLVAAKFARAQDAGLTPILCVGESLETRQAGNLFAFLEAQLQAVLDTVGIVGFGNAIVAYEPIWAIGTGETATPAQAQEVHAFIRAWFAKHDQAVAASLKILYGGSVNASTAPELFAQLDIDGGLVGGASLQLEEFINICKAANK